MDIAWLRQVMKRRRQDAAVIWRDEAYSFQDVLDAADSWRRRLEDAEIGRGSVVCLEGDYSPDSIGLMLALIELSAIIVPLTPASKAHRDEFLRDAQVQYVVTIYGADQTRVLPVGNLASHPLLLELKASGDPGLVIFTSGSTGKMKAALHNFGRLLERFREPRQALTTLSFLLMDHIGGINTLFYALSSGAKLVTVSSRDPDTVCRAIERHRVEVLPATPSFLNLLIVSEAYERYDLSSLKRVTYGTEVMPEATLARLRQLFPKAEIWQLYGLSELGILRCRSRDFGSVWLKVEGEGLQIKVVDNVLWIKTETAMLGYLNAPSPFDEEGWMNTEDVVEVDGDFIRVLGRRTEIINVGGEKVYPAEVENVLIQMDNIRDVVVYGEKNVLMGNVVVARVNVFEREDPQSLKRRMVSFCADKLARFKIPVKVVVAEEPLFSHRYKKRRTQSERKSPACSDKQER
ncbi:MAG TPA: fatty acid--CoA ligase family protein [Candidatus Obscuribacterales bacterium]